MRSFLPALTFTALSVGPAAAADLKVSFETPRLKTAQYHQPYVVIWLENAGHDRTLDLALFYSQRGGDSWLKDLRTWWRKGGRDVRLPIDGVSGATRAPGVHTLTVASSRFARLPAGQYRVVVEAAREAGGRETLSLPIELPLRAAPARNVAGTGELAGASIVVAP